MLRNFTFGHRQSFYLLATLLTTSIASFHQFSGTDPTMEALVNKLKADGVLQTERLEKVMLKFDRKKFYPSDLAYFDSPQSIGYNVTISAPHMHAHALEVLKDKLVPGNRVLDVGSGSGYLTGCFGDLVFPGGLAVGIEHVPELVQSSIENINSVDPHLIRSGVAKIIVGDGREGYPEDGPYDAIHVGAASPDEPRELIEQLKNGGILFVPVGRVIQQMVKYEKQPDGTVKRTALMNVRYVPLTDKEAQLRGR